MEPNFSSQAWENFLASERSVVQKFVGALIIPVIGFIIDYYIFDRTGLYFPSVAIVIVILTTLYCGVYFGVSSAIILSLAADYYFIPPVGAIFSSPSGYEHFFMITGLAVFVACLASSLRTAFRRAILARREAERVSKIMETVLSLVSHDIRGPLSGLQMGAEFILETPGQTARHQSILAMMLRNAKRANAMIESLLDVASMRAGRVIALDFQNCDLKVEVGNVIEEMSLAGIDRLNFTAEESICGSWGISGICRALENLVTNALKYGAPDTPIAIKLQRLGSHVAISVHNQGPEISVIAQEKLFQAFQRAVGDKKTAEKGWGLGLASVKGIAEAHGGIVTVASAKNTGTTFTLILPIRAPVLEPREHAFDQVALAAGFTIVRNQPLSPGDRGMTALVPAPE